MDTTPPKPLPDWEQYACLVEQFWSSVGAFFRASEAVDVLVESRLADNRHHATALCVAMLQDGVFLRVGAPPAPFRDVHEFRYRLTWSSAKDTGSNVRLQRAPAVPAPIASLPRKRNSPPPEFDDAISEASGEWQVKPVEYDDLIPVPSPPQHQHQQRQPYQPHQHHHHNSVEHRAYSPVPAPLPSHEPELPHTSQKQQQNHQISPLRAAFERISPRAKKERIRSSSRESSRHSGSRFKTQQNKPLARTPSLGTRDPYRNHDDAYYARPGHHRAASFDIPPPFDRTHAIDYVAGPRQAKTSLDVRDHPAPHRGSFDDKFFAGSRRERMYRASSFDVPPLAPAYLRSPSIDATDRRSSRDQFVGLSRAPWRPPSFDSIELARSSSVGAQHYAEHRPNNLITRSSSVDGRQHSGTRPPVSPSSLARSSSVDGRQRIGRSWGQSNRQTPIRPPNDSYSTPKRRENPFDISRFVPGRNENKADGNLRDDETVANKRDSNHTPVSPVGRSSDFDLGERSYEPNGTVIVPHAAPLHRGKSGYSSFDEGATNTAPVEENWSNPVPNGVHENSSDEAAGLYTISNANINDAHMNGTRTKSFIEADSTPFEEYDEPNTVIIHEDTAPAQGNEVESNGVKQVDSIIVHVNRKEYEGAENMSNPISNEANLSDSDESAPGSPQMNKTKISPEFGMETIELNADVDALKGLPNISVDLVPEKKKSSPHAVPRNIDADEIVSELKEIAIADDVSPSEIDTVVFDSDHRGSDGSPNVILLPYGPAMSGTVISTDVPTSNIDTVELMHGEHEPQESPDLTPSMNGLAGSKHDDKSAFSDVAPLRIDSGRFGTAKHESTGISSEVTSSPTDPTLIKKEMSLEIFGSPYGAITSFEARESDVRVIDIHRGEAIASIPVQKEETVVKSDNSNVSASRGHGEKENGELLGSRKKREDGVGKRKKSSNRGFMRNASDASLFGEDNVSVPIARKQSPAPAFMTRNASDASLFEEDFVGVNVVRAAVSEESGSRKMPFPSWDNEDFGSQFDVCRSFDVSKRSCDVDEDAREPVAMVAPAAVTNKRVTNSVQKGHVIEEELPQRTPYMRAPSIDVSVMDNSDDFEIEGEEPRAISMDLPRVQKREDVTQPSVERRAILLARERNRNRITQAKPEPLPNVGALREKLARAFQQPPVVPAAPLPNEQGPSPPPVMQEPKEKSKRHQQPPSPVRETEGSPVTTPRRPWRFLRVLSRGREEERASSTFTDSEGDPSSHKYRTTSSFRDRFVNSLRRSTRRAGRDTFADREDPTEQAWRSRA